MHKLESTLENETHKNLCDLKIQMDHSIPFRRPDLVLINLKKRTWHLVEFTVPEDHSENEKKGIIDRQMLGFW